MRVAHSSAKISSPEILPPPWGPSQDLHVAGECILRSGSQMEQSEGLAQLRSMAVSSIGCLVLLSL